MQKYIKNVLGDSIQLDAEMTADVQKTVKEYTESAFKASYEELEGRELDKSDPEHQRILATMSALTLMQGVAGRDGIDGVLGFTVGVLMAAMNIYIRSKKARENTIGQKGMVQIGGGDPYTHQDLRESVLAMTTMTMKAAHQIAMGYEEGRAEDAKTRSPKTVEKTHLENVQTGRVEFSEKARASMEEMGVSEEDILKMVEESLRS